MNWLFKEEPTHYGFDAFVKDKKTVWSGVKNPLAQKHLRAVRKGDRIFYYHTGDEKARRRNREGARRRLRRSGRQERQAVGRRCRAGEEAAAACDAERDQGRPRVQGFSARPASRGCRSCR